MARLKCERAFALVCLTTLGFFAYSSSAIQIDPEEELHNTANIPYTQISRQSLLDGTTIQISNISDKKPSHIESYKPRGKLLKLDNEEDSYANRINNGTDQKPKKDKHKKVKDLSDISFDDEDLEFSPHTVRIDDSRIVNKPLNDAFLKGLKNTEISAEVEGCLDNGRSYKVGDTLERSCDESCLCSADGKLICSARCHTPFFKKGRALQDPLCYEEPIDDCCAVLVCSSESEKQKVSSPDEVCQYGNTTYLIGQRWYLGCEQICQCEEHSRVNCETRCPKLEVKERCINVQDKHDSCCQVQVCDVSQDDHEVLSNEDKNSIAQDRSDVDITTEEATATSKEIIDRVEILKNNTVKIHFIKPNITSIQISQDGGKSYKQMKVGADGLISNLEHGRLYNVRGSENGRKFDVFIQSNGKKDVRNTEAVNKDGCYSNGSFYEIGEEFHMGCQALCECVGVNKTECAELHCPSQVGLELVSPTCVEWVPDPEDWKPNPPHCCPAKMKCISNGTCHYKGVEIPNWSEVDKKLTGCELSCFCESGKLDCQNFCAEVTELPPNSLRCLLGTKPQVVPVDGDDCCREWRCVPNAKTPIDAEAITPPPFYKDPINYVTIPVHIQKPPKNEQKFLGPYANPFPTDSPIEYYPKTTQYKPYPNVIMSNFPYHPHDYKPHIPYSKHPSNNTYDVIRPTQKYGEVDDLLTDLVGGEDNFKVTDHNFRATETNSSIYFPTEPPQKDLKLKVVSLQSDSPHSIRLIFEIPSTFVGLKGSVDLRYTDSDDTNADRWSFQVFAPANEVLSTSRLDFRLSDLKPSTEYKLMGILRLESNFPGLESDVVRVITQDEEKRRNIDCKLQVIEVNATDAILSWRRFTDDLLKFIDGIQVRFRPVGQPIYQSTDILHNSKVQTHLSLKPDTEYEASLVLVPPAGSTLELYDPNQIRFKTPPYVDKYNWSVILSVIESGAHSMRVTWHGIPSPAEMYIRVYKFAHTCGTQKEQKDLFLQATRNQQHAMTLTNFDAGARCRVWMEMVLTNGKVKMSNVLEVTMKLTDEAIDNEVARLVNGGEENQKTDYYSALVATGIVAALGALVSLILLFVVIKRHRPHSVSFTTVPPAPQDRSLPPYDSSTYKMDLQQETMNL